MPAELRLEGPLTVGSLLPTTAWQWIALLALVAGSLTLNLTVPPEAPIHPNTHGIQEVRTILDPGLAIEQGQFYGTIYIRLMRSICAVAGWTEGVVYATNSALGALSVLALFLLAQGLGLGISGALAAAFLLAIHPAHVWLSGSESPMPLYHCLVLTGLAAIVVGMTRHRAWLVVAGLLAIALASRVHVLTLAAFPVALGFIVWARGQTTSPAPAGFYRTVLVAVAIALALWAEHLWSLRWVPEAFAGKVRAESSVYQFTTGNLLFDPTLAAIPMVPLMAWGAVVAVRRHRALALVLGWAILALVPAGLLVNSLRTDAVRYQTPTHWVLFLLAGVAVATWLNKTRPRPWKLAALAVLGVAILANAAWGWTVVARGTVASNAYLFARKTIQDLEPRSAIHLPPLEDDYRRLLVDIPVYDEPVRVIKGERPGPGEIVFLGLDCYRDPDLFSSQFNEAGMRVACDRACQPLARTPLAEATLQHAPPKVGHHHLFHTLTVPEPTIGFYRCTPAP